MRHPLFLWPAGVAFGLAAEWAGFGWRDPGHWVPDLAVGWCLIGCGITASARRPGSGSGALMSATGFSWFLANFAGASNTAVAWASAHALYLHRGPLFHLVLAYPGGRPSSWLTRAAIGVGYVAAVITLIWRNELATIVLAAFLVAVCAREYVSAVGPPRRARLIALQAAAGLSLVLAGNAVAGLVLAPGSAGLASLLVYEVALCAIAGGLLAGLLFAPWGRAAVTASSSPGSSSTAGSWIRTPAGWPSRSTTVAERPDPGSGSASTRPCGSTNAPASPDQ